MPHLVAGGETTERVADKLFRACCAGSQSPTWVLIHIEVQATSQSDFDRRMFTCYYRILDRYNQPMVCIAVLADSSKSWRPSCSEQGLLRCRMRFEYPGVKLRGYAQSLEELEASNNPFARAIAAHLQAQSSRSDPARR